MSQISGAIIGVTVVLISVFVPLAFFSGSVGNIYRQFSAVMAVSIAFSSFMALSLTPRSARRFSNRWQAGHHLEKRSFFQLVQPCLQATAHGYEPWSRASCAGPAA